MNRFRVKTSASNDAAEWHSQIAERFDAGYRRSSAFIGRLVLWSDLIVRHARTDGDTLDAGCGSGVLSVVAARVSRSVTAFDASPEMVHLTRRKLTGTRSIGNATVRELRMENIAELGDVSFALVLSSSVLEYIQDFGAALQSLADRLKPGGTLIVSFPNMQSLYRQAERLVFRTTGRPRYLAYVKSQPSLSTLTATISVIGLTLIETHYCAGLPVLSPLARRLGYCQLADNLVVLVCRKDATAADRSGQLREHENEPCLPACG